VACPRTGQCVGAEAYKKGRSFLKKRTKGLLFLRPPTYPAKARICALAQEQTPLLLFFRKEHSYTLI
jgi:hypothetical protein